MEKIDKALVVFQDKRIRRIWFKDEWWFSVVDVIQALIESVDPQTYWRVMKKRLKDEGNETVTNCNALKMVANDGKMRLTDCANTQSLFRIIQSIPSKKAEPFKLWLAQVGKERIDEIENPELAQERMRRIYEAKGYPQEWIEKRLRGIAIRQSLTDEWREKGVKEGKDFAILTSEISKATFGMTPKEYKDFKNLPKKSKVNLRDHMNDLGLIFTMLGERVTTEISQQEKPDTFEKNKKVAKRGGKVAGTARKGAEKELGRPITSKKNYLDKKEKKKLT